MKTETKQKKQIAHIQIRNIVFELDEVCAASKLTEDEHKFAVDSIVAAPDMLAALNEVLGDLCDFQEAYPDLSNQFDGTFAKINAAIAKAEGNA